MDQGHPSFALAKSKSDERLDSWKEIAAYLKRDIRTVHRWEQEENLPIHRHLHKSRGTVYAYKSELDSWLEQRRPPQFGEKEEISGTRGARTSWKLYGVLALVMVFVVGAIYFIPAHIRDSHRSTGKLMLVVLPFESLSGRPEDDYFSDGLTEEMITQLGGLEPTHLGVIGRASAMQYKNSHKSANQIGRELGVDYILEGTVRQEGQQVRVTAQLIQVGDQTQIWAQTYDSDLRAMLRLQSEIATAIAHQTRLSLTADTRERLQGGPLVNPEAQERYLKGRYFWNKFDVPDLKKSVEYFQEALAKDPGYAQAYAGLAASYGVLSAVGAVPPREACSKAKAAAQKALQIDETLSEGHLQMGFSEQSCDYDWAGAEREFRRAIELNPSNASAHEGLAEYLAALGRFAEATAEINRARDLDPLSLFINEQVGFVHYLARQYDPAIVQLQKTIEIDPNFVPTYWVLARIYEAKNMPEEAYQMNLKLARLSGGPVAELEDSHSKGGWRAACRKVMYMCLHATNEQNAYFLAESYVSLGDKEQAIKWLSRAIDERYNMVIFA